MKVDAAPSAPKSSGFRRALRAFENATGQFALAWVLVALLNLAAQAIFFRQMVAPDRPAGEFGIFNGTLGLAGLLTVPAMALPLAFRYFFMRSQSTKLDVLRESPAVLTETFTWFWGVCCIVLMLLPFPLPALPRFSLDAFTTMNVLLMLGAVISGVVCAEARQERRWALLLVTACLVRLALGGWITAYQPSAEAVLTAYVVGGFITLAPALRSRGVTWARRLLVCAAALDRSFLRFAAATLSMMLGIYLFTNADRIAAMNWWNVKINGIDMPSAQLRHILDIYQAVGLLARGLLWGTQPLLWILYLERSVLEKTTPRSLRFFWIYLGALLLGALALGFLASKGGPVDSVIPQAGSIGSTFAAVMVPLGMLQGLGVFALASRRYPECHLLGACGIVYAIVLDLVGSRPQMMLPLMFGSSIVVLMIILFVGVVRWGRRQP